MIGKYLKYKPKIDKTAFIAEGVQISGAVEVKDHASIWYNVVIRGDINKIFVGSYSNVQDGSIVHVDHDKDVKIGNYVTIGHGAIIHGCHIEDGALIGMGAIILNGALIGKGAKIGAGALIKEEFKVPANTLVVGVPGKVIRELRSGEREKSLFWAKKYAKLAEEFMLQNKTQP